MAGRAWDLLAATAVAFLAIISALAHVSLPALRILFALALVCFLPGYTMLAALVPRHTLNKTLILVASVGLSLAYTALGGLALNLTPWGLQNISWALFLGGTTIGAALFAYWRWPGDLVVPSLRHLHIPVWDSALIGLAVLVVASAIGIAVVGAVHQPQTGFTQMWFSPRDVGDPDSTHVTLDVKSQELSRTPFQVRIVVGNTVVNTYSFDLAPGATWEVILDKPKGDVLEALLYRTNDQSKAYRHVVLWPTTTATR